MDAKVLFVDDEKNVLDSINRMLYDEEYEVLLASSGAAALELIAHNPVQVIVSDMRMPEMNGVEFLKQSRSLCPDAIRMVLSGQADTGCVMDSINYCGIWRFIAKPWSDDDMKLTIRNAIDLYGREAERKMLLAELKEKNEQLDGMNRELEKKVGERTRFISEENRLLNLIVGGADIETVAREACWTVGVLIGREDVFICKAFGNNGIYNHRGEAPDEEIRRIAGESLIEQTQTPGLYSIPLQSGEALLGRLVFRSTASPSDETVKGIHQNIAPIVAIALSFEKMAMDAPDFLNNLDTLITGL
jgi:DNA-binding NarL/FixJ family response regulator